MILPHAVIIAGGKGERLGGVRKATLRVGGVRLVDRVAGALGAVRPPLMVATGPGEGWLDLPQGAMAAPDLATPVGGPLAGLAAAVEYLWTRSLGEGLLVSVAVDTPFLPENFVNVMRESLGEAPAAFAGWGDQFYPPNAIWRIEALAELPEQVRRGEAPPSLKALQRISGACLVDWTRRASTDPFANINTVDDLLALGRLT